MPWMACAERHKDVLEACRRSWPFGRPPEPEDSLVNEKRKGRHPLPPFVILYYRPEAQSMPPKISGTRYEMMITENTTPSRFSHIPALTMVLIFR